MRLGRKIVSVVVLGLVGSLALLILAEGQLRLLDRPKEELAGWAWRGPAEESNEFGFRGRRASSRNGPTVVLLGDSQVETTRPLGSMPETYLESTLNELSGQHVRVVSVGAAGWGQDQQLLALREHLSAISPRLVVLWFTPGNDLWNNTFVTHMPRDGWPKPTFWLEGDRLRGPHAPWLKPHRDNGWRLGRALRRLRGLPMYITDNEWESRLPPPYQAPMATGTAPRSLVDFVAERRGLTRHEAERLLAHEDFGIEKTHYHLALYPRSPRLEYSARLTRSLLLEIAKLCEEHGSQFVVFMVEESYFGLPDEPTLFEIAGRLVSLSGASAQALVDEVLRGLETVKVPGSAEDFQISKTDGHLNDDGNRYYMVELARRLVPRLTR